MKTNIVRYRTCVCNINYHVVWCVKYRRKIITHQKEQFLKEKDVNSLAVDNAIKNLLLRNGMLLLRCMRMLSSE